MATSDTHPAQETSASAPANAATRRLGLLTIGLVWALMMVGSLMRAFGAGTACPDWPLCHGSLLPPLTEDTGAMGLAFLHRALALMAAVSALAVAALVWRAGRRGLAVALLSTLALQVLAGALTVWLETAALAVVLHLALALSFLGCLAVAYRQVLSPLPASLASRPPTGYGATAVLLVAQMIVGAAVSSGVFGLACSQFPLCEHGELFPTTWTTAHAWQMLHRALGVLVLAATLALAVRSMRLRQDRPLALSLALGALAQWLLGGANVWLRLEPVLSSLHLGLAAALFTLLAVRLARPARPRSEPATPGLAHHG